MSDEVYSLSELREAAGKEGDEQAGQAELPTYSLSELRQGQAPESAAGSGELPTYSLSALRASSKGPEEVVEQRPVVEIPGTVGDDVREAAEMWPGLLSLRLPAGLAFDPEKSARFTGALSRAMLDRANTDDLQLLDEFMMPENESKNGSFVRTDMTERYVIRGEPKFSNAVTLMEGISRHFIPSVAQEYLDNYRDNFIRERAQDYARERGFDVNAVVPSNFAATIGEAFQTTKEEGPKSALELAYKDLDEVMPKTPWTEQMEKVFWEPRVRQALAEWFWDPRYVTSQSESILRRVGMGTLFDASKETFPKIFRYHDMEPEEIAEMGGEEAPVTEENLIQARGILRKTLPYAAPGITAAVQNRQEVSEEYLAHAMNKGVLGIITPDAVAGLDLLRGEDMSTGRWISSLFASFIPGGQFITNTVGPLLATGVQEQRETLGGAVAAQVLDKSNALFSSVMGFIATPFVEHGMRRRYLDPQDLAEQGSLAMVGYGDFMDAYNASDDQQVFAKTDEGEFRPVGRHGRGEDGQFYIQKSAEIDIARGEWYVKENVLGFTDIARYFMIKHPLGTAMGTLGHGLLRVAQDVAFGEDDWTDEGVALRRLKDLAIAVPAEIGNTIQSIVGGEDKGQAYLYFSTINAATSRIPFIHEEDRQKVNNVLSLALMAGGGKMAVSRGLQYARRRAEAKSGVVYEELFHAVSDSPFLNGGGVREFGKRLQVVFDTLKTAHEAGAPAPLRGDAFTFYAAQNFLTGRQLNWVLNSPQGQKLSRRLKRDLTKLRDEKIRNEMDSGAPVLDDLVPEAYLGSIDPAYHASRVANGYSHRISEMLRPTPEQLVLRNRNSLLERLPDRLFKGTVDPAEMRANLESFPTTWSRLVRDLPEPGDMPNPTISGFYGAARRRAVDAEIIRTYVKNGTWTEAEGAFVGKMFMKYWANDAPFTLEGAFVDFVNQAGQKVLQRFMPDLVATHQWAANTAYARSVLDHLSPLTKGNNELLARGYVREGTLTNSVRSSRYWLDRVLVGEDPAVIYWEAQRLLSQNPIATESRLRIEDPVINGELFGAMTERPPLMTARSELGTFLHPTEGAKWEMVDAPSVYDLRRLTPDAMTKLSDHVEGSLRLTGKESTWDAQIYNWFHEQGIDAVIDHNGSVHLRAGTKVMETVHTASRSELSRRLESIGGKWMDDGLRLAWSHFDGGEKVIETLRRSQDHLFEELVRSKPQEDIAAPGKQRTNSEMLQANAEILNSWISATKDQRQRVLDVYNSSLWFQSMEQARDAMSTIMQITDSPTQGLWALRKAATVDSQIAMAESLRTNITRETDTGPFTSRGEVRDPLDFGDVVNKAPGIPFTQQMMTGINLLASSWLDKVFPGTSKGRDVRLSVAAIRQANVSMHDMSQKVLQNGFRRAMDLLRSDNRAKARIRYRLGSKKFDESIQGLFDEIIGALEAKDDLVRLAFERKYRPDPKSGVKPNTTWEAYKVAQESFDYMAKELHTHLQSLGHRVPADYRDWKLADYFPRMWPDEWRAYWKDPETGRKHFAVDGKSPQHIMIKLSEMEDLSKGVISSEMLRFEPKIFATREERSLVNSEQYLGGISKLMKDMPVEVATADWAAMMGELKQLRDYKERIGQGERLSPQDLIKMGDIERLVPRQSDALSPQLVKMGKGRAQFTNRYWERYFDNIQKRAADLQTYSKDLPRVGSLYIGKAIRKIHVDKIVNAARLGAERVPEFAPWFQDVAMRYKGRRDGAEVGIDRAFNALYLPVARRFNKYAKEQTYILQRMFRPIRSFFTHTKLGGNIALFVVNSTQTAINTGALIGAKYTSWGAWKGINPSGVLRINGEVRTIRSILNDAPRMMIKADKNTSTHSQGISGHREALGRKERTGERRPAIRIGDGVDAALDTWMKPFMSSESWNKRSTFLGGYRYAREKLGFDHGQAIAYGERLTSLTQFVPLVVDTPMILRNSLANNLLMFQTFTFRQLGVMRLFGTDGKSILKNLGRDIVRTPEQAQLVDMARPPGVVHPMIRMMGAYTALGGIEALPAVTDVIDLASKRSKEDLRKTLEEFLIRKFGKVPGRAAWGFVEGGLPGTLEIFGKGYGIRLPIAVIDSVRDFVDSFVNPFGPRGRGNSPPLKFSMGLIRVAIDAAMGESNSTAGRVLWDLINPVGFTRFVNGIGSWLTTDTRHGEYVKNVPKAFYAPKLWGGDSVYRGRAQVPGAPSDYESGMKVGGFHTIRYLNALRDSFLLGEIIEDQEAERAAFFQKIAQEARAEPLLRVFDANGRDLGRGAAMDARIRKATARVYLNQDLREEAIESGVYNMELRPFGFSYIQDKVRSYLRPASQQKVRSAPRTSLYELPEEYFQQGLNSGPTADRLEAAKLSTARTIQQIIHNGNFTAQEKAYLNIILQRRLNSKFQRR